MNDHQSTAYRPAPIPGSGGSRVGNMQDVISGQKLIILAVGVWIVTIVYNLLAAAAVVPSITAVPFIGWLAAAVLGIVGVVKATNGLGWSTGARIVTVILLFIPLISLITLLIVNARATLAQRNAGYQVGLFGAKT